MGRVITIDGPAASGKTSVSRELARKLGFKWVSTGAFYRGLAYAAMKLNTNLDDEKSLKALCTDPVWRVQMDDDSTKVFFQNQDVTDQITQESVGNIASKISHYPKVREQLLQPQRDCKKVTQGLVAEGRDCGTVVFPEAEYKFYLTADPVNRAERRAKELGLSQTETEAAQIHRDKQDQTRKTAPLQVPANAIVVDTTYLSFDEVIETIFKKISNL